MQFIGEIEKDHNDTPHYAADLILSYLEQLNIEYVFGIPGGAIEPFYNALARSARRGGIQPIVARHESGAAFMAEGYTRETGKLGVVCTTTGPGATNAITGVASAYRNEIPMLVITAQTSTSHFGKEPFQDSSCTGINSLGMFQYCTHYNTLVSHTEQLEHKLAAAIMTAHGATKGPVHLTIPLDILGAPLAHAEHHHFDLPKLLKQPALIDEARTAELHERLRHTQHAAFLIGSGCAGASHAVLKVANILKAPVVTTPCAKGLINAHHPLYRGVFGFAGHRSAQQVLHNPANDVIVAVGTHLTEWSTRGWDAQLLNSKLVHIDANPKHMTQSPMASLHVHGNIEKTFEKIAHLLFQDAITNAPNPEQRNANKHPHPAINHSAPPDNATPGRHTFTAPPNIVLDEKDKYLDDSSPIKPQALMRKLAQLFPHDTCFLSDTGNSLAWAIHYLHLPDQPLAHGRRPQQNQYHANFEFSAMGWALGCAIGIAIADRSRPVVSILGDGSFLMGGQELTVAIEQQLPVVYVVLNDSGLGMVKHGQRLSGAESIGYEMSCVNFAELARSLGATGHTIRTLKDLDNLNIKAICSGVPALLDAYIDVEEIPPIHTRTNTLRHGKSLEYRT